MVTDIKLAQIPDLCDRLAQEIRNIRFSPDAIVAVERAGRLLASNLQRHFDVPIIPIYVARSGTIQKHRFSFILRLLPRSIRTCLRLLELYSGYHKLCSRREVQCSFRFPSKDSHILIVDDTIDTGNTMQAVIDFLLAQGFSRDLIKTAVISTKFRNPLVKPDAFLLREFCSFPWSADSLESDLLEKEYERIGWSIKNDEVNPGDS